MRSRGMLLWLGGGQARRERVSLGPVTGGRGRNLKREILINGSQRETRVAILEDDRLVELLVDRPDHRRMVGDIYLGRVEAVLPGIQAAFVDIGLEKSAFLHASDLLEPDDEHDPDEEPADVADSPSNDTPPPEVGEADVPRSSRRRRRRGRGNASTGSGPVEGGGEGGAEGGPESDGFDGGDDGAEGGEESDGGNDGAPAAEGEQSGQGGARRSGRRGRRRGRRRGKGGADRAPQGGAEGGLVPEDQIAGFLPRTGEVESSADEVSPSSEEVVAPRPERQERQQRQPKQPKQQKQQQKQQRQEKQRSQPQAQPQSQVAAP